MNIFKLYWSVSKPTNIKSYSSIWVRHQRIYERSDLIFTGSYIRQWSHVTDEYTWHVFVGDVAPPTNIWGTALSLRARLTDGYRRDLKTGVSFFSLSPRALHFNHSPAPLPPPLPPLTAPPPPRSTVAVAT
jgi:hypothetical protein